MNAGQFDDENDSHVEMIEILDDLNLVLII